MMERLDDYLEQQDRQEAIDEVLDLIIELSSIWGSDNTREWWRCNNRFHLLPWNQTADVIRSKIASVKKQQRFQWLPY